MSSTGFLGVAKAGFRKAGAGGLAEALDGENRERGAVFAFEGLAKGFGRCGLDMGDPKPEVK